MSYRARDYERKSEIAREIARARRHATDRSGASLLQTPGSVSAELHQINVDYESFASEFQQAMASGFSGVSGVNKEQLEKLFRDDWTPLLAAWRDFFSKNGDGSWWWNYAPEGEEYLRKLKDVRSSAESAGLHIYTPKPTEIRDQGILPNLANAMTGTGDPGKSTSVTGALKAAALAAVAIGGTYAVVKIVSKSTNKA